MNEIRKWKKKKYNKKLEKSIKLHKDFLVERLKQEWKEAEKEHASNLKKEEIIRRSKETAAIVAKTILVFLVISSVLTVAVVAPNIFTIFGRRSRRRYFFEKESYNKAVKYLRDKDFIEIRKTKGVEEYDIVKTNQGFDKAVFSSFNDLKVKQPHCWDNIWRVVIFDIPEKYRWGREGLNKKLKDMGFYPLQKSAFIYPYPCRSEIEFLISFFGIAHYVRFIETQFIDQDDDLKKEFELL